MSHPLTPLSRRALLTRRLRGVRGWAFHVLVVCNTCGEVVTGATREHAEMTGHDGFTTGVPIEHEVLVSEAWDETVVDEPASSEMVHVADECAGCGEVRDVPDEAVE